MEICAIRPLVDCRDTIEAMVASKRDRLEKIMEWRAFYSRSPIDNATNYFWSDIKDADSFNAEERILHTGFFR
jgi:hypothetical protein